MTLLVRKISRAKWPSQECSIDEIFADAIGDLKTTNNTLSFWEISSEEELEAAALALSASSKSERLETISIVWIPKEDLTDSNILIKSDNPGDTVIEDLAQKHRDLYKITYKSLGILARFINDEIMKNHCKRYTRKEVRIALAQAYKDNRICIEKCNPTLLKEITDHNPVS